MMLAHDDRCFAADRRLDAGTARQPSDRGPRGNRYVSLLVVLCLRVSDAGLGSTV